ncbi:hypothetical protein VNO80_16927 [Phaseolus coccineus]|uniref:Uncharacterized protein n=1 Tax=Phaseolus coccineus TaxID=3886 RepID=A0AAN9R372_PHACN
MTMFHEFGVMQCTTMDQTLFIFNLHTLHKAELGLVGEVSFSVVCFRESVWTVEYHLYITGKQWKFPVMTQFNEGKTKYKWLLVPMEKDKLSASASGTGPLVHMRTPTTKFVEQLQKAPTRKHPRGFPGSTGETVLK